MDGRIARPRQRFSTARPLTVLARPKHWQSRDPRAQALKSTPLHTHTIPHFSILASTTRSHFRLIVIPSQNGYVRSLQQAHPPVPRRGRTGYNRKERSSNVAARLRPVMHRPVTPGLSFLPSSSTQCLSSHSASTPRWRPPMSRAKTPKPC